MKPLLCIVLACAALSGVPLAAMADGASTNPQQPSARGWLLGTGLGVIEYREAGLSSTEPDYLYLQGGWRFNRHFMLEARLGTDAPGGGDPLSFGMPLRVRVQQIYGVYARAAIPVFACCEFYGLIGYTGIRWQTDVEIAALHGPAGSASYGTGFTWNINSRVSADLELMPELVTGAGWHSDALTVGIRWQL